MLSAGSAVDHDEQFIKESSNGTSVDFLRRTILGIHSDRIDHLSLDLLLNDYFQQIDSMKTINNYADNILQLAARCTNDSSHWRSAFATDDLIKELEVETTEGPHLVMQENEPNAASTDQLSSILPTIFKKHSLSASMASGRAVPGSTDKVNLPVPVTSVHDSTRSHPTYKRSLTNLSPLPASASVDIRSLEISKRFHSELPEPDKPSDLFQTAGAVLQQNLQTKQPSGYRQISSSYGVTKRTLGGRRGPSTHFVPPIPSGSSPSASCRPQTAGPSNRLQTKDGDCPMGDQRLKQFDQKMVDLIMSEVMESKTVISWEDIAGLEFQKKALQEVVILPMLRPDLFTGLRGPPKGLLLFGPPGTGKTLIGKCIASQSKSTFFSISASSLTSKWVGEGEKMVRALFAIARINQPAVIFIDEVDSLLTQRSEMEHESSRRIKTEFLVQLDGVSTGGDERLLFVGATNRPQELDEAARRRFVKRLYIPLPDRPARKQIVVHLFRQQRHSMAPNEFDLIADKTQGYSGADMANLCREAAMGPIRSLSPEAIQRIACDEVRPVVLADFESALNHVRASVSSGDLQHYLKWNKQYGSFDA
ncbi:hypothetical protein CRM22_004754 [Opisthorchis felineus]|uniref:Fidgetin-like protein 1 n=1 Tax=Opisthorchis felineus TaxID=147828 RepID=A0A4S2LUL1_OPIFE|nr:hypothetical protein CRM22_004754 [Opisthorchis felineus]